jgi:transcriptional antiterminator RfaH
MTERWYVIRTKPNSDGLAASAMEREGFKLFFPRVNVPTGEHRRKTVPLFPGCLFLRCDFRAHTLPIVSRFPGVLGWVRFDGNVPHLPDEVIAELQNRIDAIHGSGGLWQKFRAGQLVRVSHGKLDALAIVLDEPASPEARVRVLLEFMGRQVPATVPWRNLSLDPAPSDESPLKRNRRTRGRGRWIREFGPKAVTQT